MYLGRRPRRCWFRRWWRWRQVVVVAVLCAALIGVNFVYLSDENAVSIKFRFPNTGEARQRREKFHLHDHQPHHHRLAAGKQTLLLREPSLTESARDRMKRRQTGMSDYCAAHATSQELSPVDSISTFRKNALISRRHRLMYCPVGKGASTFLTRFFIAAEETNPVISPFAISSQKAMRVRKKHGDRRATFQSLQNLMDRRREKAVLNKLSRVLFVRNPYERLWSAYVDKLVFPNLYYWEEWGLPATTMFGSPDNTKLEGRVVSIVSRPEGNDANNSNNHLSFSVVDKKVIGDIANNFAPVTKDSQKLDLTAQNVRFFRAGRFEPSDLMSKKILNTRLDSFRSEFKDMPVLSFLGHHHNLGKKTDSGDVSECGQSVTFSQFAKYVLKELHKVDTHVMPVHWQCAPCYVNYDVIGHVETMTSDFFHIVRLLNISSKHLEGLNVAEEHAKDMIKEAVGNLFKQWLPDITACVTKNNALQRLWRVFQIKGIISHSQAYPFTEKDLAQTDAQTVENELLSAWRRSERKEELDRQRNTEMAEAYRALDETDLEQLQRIYKADFEMFGYGYQLPT